MSLDTCCQSSTFGLSALTRLTYNQRLGIRILRMFVLGPRWHRMPFRESEVISMSITVKLYETKSGNHKVWLCRWYSGGKRGTKTLGRVSDISRREAKAQRKELEDSFTKGEQSPIKVKGMSLRQFADMYPNRRRKQTSSRGYLKESPKLSESTITDHVMTIRYLIEHFGESRRINDITLDDAYDWTEALEGGRLTSARKISNQNYGMSEQTVRGHIRNAKAAYNWAILFDVVQSNPFAKFDGAPIDTEPNQYVTLKDFHKLYRAAPTTAARLMLAICRLGGLRREAARTLPWSGFAIDSYGKKHLIGIDWDKRRIRVVGNHKGRKYPKRFREAPIRPLLYRLLLKAYHNAEPGAESITQLSPNNLTRLGQSITKAAGLPPIKAFYQTLRSSCENDWKIRGHAEVTYCGWAGHSPMVSRKHYVAPTDQEFAAATKVA